MGGARLVAAGRVCAGSAPTGLAAGSEEVPGAEKGLLRTMSWTYLVQKWAEKEGERGKNNKRSLIHKGI